MVYDVSSFSGESRPRGRLRRGTFLLALLAAGLLCPAGVGAAQPPDAEAKEDKRVGYAVKIALPIDGRALDRTKQFVYRAIEKAREDDARLTLVFEFKVPPDQAEFGRGSEFGASLSLAEFLSSDKLNGVRTVAYIPMPIQGHAVLVALACDEIIMAPDAAIGPAGVDEKVVTESRRGNYRELADKRKTIPAPVAIWLLDPSQEVLVVETEVSREYVTAAGLEALKKQHAIKSQRKLYDDRNPQRSLASEPGKLTGQEARELNLVSYLAKTRDEVAKALDLPAGSLEENPSMVREWNAVRVDLKGPITANGVNQIRQIIDRQVRQEGVDFICLLIDSPGGSLTDSLDLARDLSRYSGQGVVRTVAYIPSQARSDAAIVALACREVVMGSDAQLGGPGAGSFSREEIRQARVSISDQETGPWRHRHWSPVAAMIDPKLDVYRCTRDSETAYLSELEIEDIEKREPNAKRWQKHEQITLPGDPLELTGRRAKDLGLITAVADSFGEFRSLYGLETDPRRLEPGWADSLIDALASPSAAAILLMIGFIALYIELHTPGIGVGGFVAAVCFVIFFWSRFLGGTAGWLEASLFVAGIAFLLVEFLVLPGFGIFGLGGGILVLVSLVLASQTFVLPHNAYQFAQLQRSLLTIAGAGVGFLAVALVLRAWLPKAPLLNQVFLPPPEGEEAETISRREALARYDDLLGQRGTTTTQLTPSGKARIGERLVDVISDGDLIARHATVEVVEVRGSRVVVREVI